MNSTLFTQFAAEEAEAKGLAALGLDSKAFIVQLITFLLVFYVLRRFVFKRVVDLLETRQAKIDEGLSLTTKLSEEKAKLDKDAAKVRQEARKEAEEIVASSHAQAKALVKEAEDAAQLKADAIVADAQKKIADEANRARRQLEKEMVDLVVEATEAVTREKLDAKKDGVLIANALKGQA